MFMIHETPTETDLKERIHGNQCAYANFGK
jgi:hypothetical protein